MMINDYDSGGADYRQKYDAHFTNKIKYNILLEKCLSRFHASCSVPSLFLHVKMPLFIMLTYVLWFGLYIFRHRRTCISPLLLMTHCTLITGKTHRVHRLCLSFARGTKTY